MTVTTTTSPSRASTPPSKPGADPAQVTQPPPCSQTITGRGVRSRKAGVKTFSDRQSSPIGSIDTYQPVSGEGASAFCGAEWPNARAGRTPLHGLTGCGGKKRFAPPVGAPYGMPLKTKPCAPRVPSTLPVVVSTIGSASAAPAPRA